MVDWEILDMTAAAKGDAVDNSQRESGWDDVRR
jgi:hypothetical protein